MTRRKSIRTSDSRPSESRTSRRRASTRPFPREFQALCPPGDEHPVARQIDNIPAIAAKRHSLVKQAGRWQTEASDQAAFIGYEDARTDLQVRREELYFDAGYHRGIVAGRAVSGSASMTASKPARDLARAVREAVLSAALPRDRAVAVLLELMRALVLGLRLPATPR